MSQDNIFHILSLLPAKMICKSKTVCKSFYFSTLLDEVAFQMKQAQNSLDRDDPCFFIQPVAGQRGHIRRVELHALPGEQSSSGAPNNVVRFLSKYAIVLSSSNGLILCCTKEKYPKLFICNPVTLSWSPIPVQEQLRRKPNVNFNAVLKCYPGSPDDYVVLLFIKPIACAGTYICKVYKAKEGVWESVERHFFAGDRSMEFNVPPVHHNGALHFISDISDSFPRVAKWSPYFKPYIMSYNLENGLSTMLRLPEEASKGFLDTSFTCNMGIFKWGKASSLTSICLVRLRKSAFTVWLLEDYRSSSWQKVLKVRVKAMGLKEKDPNIKGFTVMNGDLLILATEEKVYSYGLTGERYMMLEEICEHKFESRVCFISYSDTLRPCGTVAAAATLPLQKCLLRSLEGKSYN